MHSTISRWLTAASATALALALATAPAVAQACLGLGTLDGQGFAAGCATTRTPRAGRCAPARTHPGSRSV